MSRKHFVLMAETIAKIESLEARKGAFEAFAKVAATTNPRFDLERFRTACGL